jgi:peptide/nickel transport system permease protein
LLRLLISRFAQGVAVLLLVSFITFSLLAAAGGDAVSAFGPDMIASESAVAELRRVYGLDQPFHVRYARWLGNVVQGDLGRSFYFRSPVAPLIGSRLVATLWISFLALSFSIAIGGGLGLLAAVRRNGVIDKLSSLMVLIASSTPRIVVALVALAVIVRTSWMRLADDSGGAGLLTGKALIGALILAVPLIAIFIAQVKDGMLVSLSEDFVQVARAKGLSERTVVLKHALRGALNPVITIAGYALGGLISGSIIVERILGWPGIGQLSVTAVISRDVPLMMGVVLVTATAVLLANLAADLLLYANDPRMRIAREGRSSKAAPAGTGVQG